MMRVSGWELSDSDSLNEVEGDELEEMLQAEDLGETGKRLKKIGAWGIMDY